MLNYALHGAGQGRKLLILSLLLILLTLMKHILPITLLLFLAFGANAQFTVTSNNNAAALAQKIVGQGVTILNPVFKGSTISAGFFVDRSGRLGIDSGIVLTTGRAQTIGTSKGANAPADGLRTSAVGGFGGDADLSTYAGVATKDACILEFDFVPQGDSVNVKFIFASDEYQGAAASQVGYICSNVNDAFAFLISGPGIIGLKNIALVPGTDIPVAINTINNGQVNNNNNGTLSNCTQYGAGSPFTGLYVDNRNGSDISYNGMTQVLRAQAKVVPCNVYHIKLVIADGLDDVFDSGVFIEASSFSSNGITASSSGGFTDAQNNSIVVEGCRNSQIKIQLSNPPSTPLTLPLSYSGTATFGVDYAAMPSSIVFGVNETEKVLDVVAITDNVNEPTESIIISVGSNACSNTATSSVTILIKDSISFGRVKDTFVCSKFPTLLTAPHNDTTTNKYLWNNGDTTRQATVFLPGNNYWVVHTFSNNCYNIDTFHVVNGDPVVSVGNDVSICSKDSTLVTANVQLQTGGSYLWNTNETSQSIYVKQSGNYSVKYTAPNGCYLNDDLNAIAKPLPYANLGNDTALCSYETLQLNAYYPNASYVWSTGSTSPSITVSDDGLYIVTSSLDGCEVKDSIEVARKNTPLANAGPDTTILEGGTAKLVAMQDVNNDRYEWFPHTIFNYPTAYNPYASPTVTGFVYLKVTSTDNCVAMDTLQITVNDYLVNIPNAFSPNGDGVNDTWQIPLFSSYIYSKVQVFNRNGQLVFSSVGYDRPWNGTQNGKPLPVGTYYYVIEPGMGRPLRTGSITILN